MKGYIKTDKQLHQLAQILAKFNRTTVNPKEDDSHTNLGFDELGERIFGRWAELKGDNYIMALNLTDYSFEFIDGGRNIVESFTIENKRQNELENEIAGYIRREFNVNKEDFLKELHYEIPTYNFLNMPYNKPDENDLNDWIELRALANNACSLLLNAVQADSEIRIWPHHFDTGVYIELGNNLGLGFGLAMQDTMVNQPYFYFAGYGLADNGINFDNTNNLTKGGWLLSKYWKGAILHAPEASKESVSVFLLETLQWYLDNNYSTE